MGLCIYNTLTRQKEPFESLMPGVVSMYVCGPTVYDRAHVGHAMSALVFDVIRRYLEYRGYRVKHVMNYTDVDDKIIQRAFREEVDPFELAEGLIADFYRHLQDLNILLASVYPRATQEIDQIVRMIQGLEAKGYAYPVDGDVYFRVTKDEDYGKLSRRRLDDMQAGARVGVDERKEHPMDFALWKSSKPSEPAWDSPWGTGRPGWHIECSAMNFHHLGEQIDIHGGGNDLIFPHHENEIAQTESLTGKPFARFWIHNGMMQFAGEKMSKSLGNVVSVTEFLSKHEGNALRMMVLNSSYRGPLTYSEEVVQQTERALERLRSALRREPAGAGEDSASAREAAAALNDQMEATRQGFLDAMDDDFNTAGAMGHLFDLVRAINQAGDSGVGGEALKTAQDLLRELAGVFGLELDRPATRGGDADPFISLLVEVRGELRKQKLWALADQVRGRLVELGVVIEDGKDGTSWRWS
jgi:cysteinyl-tRNA synthetase